MNRRHSVRTLLALGAFAAGATARVAQAHHGWSSFDTERPQYLEGRALTVQWRNPHAELVLELPADLRLPADLNERPLPAQVAPVDGPGLLRRAQVPTRRERRWVVELAPLTRMSQWQVPEIKAGTLLAVLGFGLAGERAEALVRAEYLFLAGRVYPLRSGPATP